MKFDKHTFFFTLLGFSLYNIPLSGLKQFVLDTMLIPGQTTTITRVAILRKSVTTGSRQLEKGLYSGLKTQQLIYLQTNPPMR